MTLALYFILAFTVGCLLLEISNPPTIARYDDASYLEAKARNNRLERRLAAIKEQPSSYNYSDND